MKKLIAFLGVLAMLLGIMYMLGAWDLMDKEDAEK